MSSSRMKGLAIAILAGAAAFTGGAINTGRDALNFLANSDPGPTFGQRYGSNPNRYNGGRARHWAALDKRAARKRRQARKHPKHSNGRGPGRRS